MYNVNKSELNVKIDVDNTILSWIEPNKQGIGKVKISYADTFVYLTPHNYHIQLLKMYKMRGYHVTVWSANGWQHAVNAVDALDIGKYVDVIETKPTKHMDDSEDAGSILGPRVFEKDLTAIEYIFVPFGAMQDGVDNNTVVIGGIANGR